MQQDGGVASASEERKLVMVVLCGLIGSGKSSFAKALQEYYPEYIRCNQDILGSRNAVKSLATRSLYAGHHVVIDRTNVDEIQRATWVDLAHSVPNVELQAIVFQTPLEVCKDRLAIRTDHETIRDPAHALDVLQRFHRDFVIPIHSEGFQRIISVYPNEFASAIPTKEEVDAILARLQQEPLVNVPLVRSAAVVDRIAQRGNRGRTGRGGRCQSRGVAPNQRGPFHGAPRGDSGGGFWQQRSPSHYQQQPQEQTLYQQLPHNSVEYLQNDRNGPP